MVETIAIEELVEEVISDLPGCDVMQGVDKLRETAIEFFKVTGLWKHSTPWLDVHANEPNYRLTFPQQSIPDKILVSRFKVEDGAQPYFLYPKSEVDLERLYNGEWEAIEGTPRWYTHVDDVLVARLVPIPIEEFTAALFFRMTVTPTRDATELPAALTNKYWQALAAGARHRLAAMKDQPWSDPGKSAVALSKYNTGLAVGTNDRSQSHTTSPQKMMAEFPLA